MSDRERKQTQPSESEAPEVADEIVDSGQGEELTDRIDDILDEMLEKMGMAGVDAEDKQEAQAEEKPDEAEDINEALLESLSVHKQVSSQMPPTFLVHTANDAEVPCENSILLSEALRKKGVPMEFHLYEEGPHGFGLALNQPHLATWTGLCARWLQLRGFVGSIKESE